jgi:hypothetical protein
MLTMNVDSPVDNGMIEIDEIKDWGILRDWLKEWPKSNGLSSIETRVMAVSIAHRASMRLLPLCWDQILMDQPNSPDNLLILNLRCNLISGVVAKYPTPQLTDASAAVAGTTMKIGISHNSLVAVALYSALAASFGQATVAHADQAVGCYGH